MFKGCVPSGKNVPVHWGIYVIYVRGWGGLICCVGTKLCSIVVQPPGGSWEGDMCHIVSTYVVTGHRLRHALGGRGNTVLLETSPRAVQSH